MILIAEMFGLYKSINQRSIVNNVLPKAKVKRLKKVRKRK